MGRPLPVIRKKAAHEELICPHCNDVIHERHARPIASAIAAGKNLFTHTDCGGHIMMPRTIRENQERMRDGHVSSRVVQTMRDWFDREFGGSEGYPDYAIERLVAQYYDGGIEAFLAEFHPEELPRSPAESKSKAGRRNGDGKRRVKEVVTNNQGGREEVYNDNEQVANEGVTTGAIAAPMASFPGSVQTKGTAGRQTMPKHKMPQEGKPIGGRSVTKDKGGTGTDCKEHGDPFGHALTNKGGQFEPMKGSKHEGELKEFMTPAEIANTLIDGGLAVQTLFDDYARGANYISLREFNEVATSYDCQVHDEQTLMQLMEANQEFMFVEGQDAQGRYWITQINENIANFGGKKAKPFGKGGKKDEEEETDDDGEEEFFKAEHAGDEGETNEESANHDGRVVAESEDQADEMRLLVEQVTGRPQGKRLPNGTRQSINESNTKRRKPLTERFQIQSPDEHFAAHRDPGYEGAEDFGDVPLFNDTEMDADDEFGAPGMGHSPEEEAEHEGSAMRSGEANFGFGDDGSYGSGDMCPTCKIELDELGCPTCGYCPDEFEQSTFSDPAAAAAGLEDFRNTVGSQSMDDFERGGGGIPDIDVEFDEPAEVAEVDDEDFNTEDGARNFFDRVSRSPEMERTGRRNESRGRGRRPLNESLSGKGHKMDRQGGGKGLVGGMHNDSGLKGPDTEMSDMGANWPRKQKNTGGGVAEKFGDSKHTEASDGIQNSEGETMSRKQKNKGGQWEEFEGGQHGGKMSGGAKKMHESITMLDRHVRKMLAEYAREGQLRVGTGKYQMRFVVSAGDAVKPKIHNRLTEALADAEELTQILGPEAVSFEAQFCQDGSCALKRLVPMIRIPDRGPIVQEGQQGGRLLFRFPEIARGYADLIVREGRACRAVTHNWGAAISAGITLAEANKLFSGLKTAPHGGPFNSVNEHFQRHRDQEPVNEVFGQPEADPSHPDHRPAGGDERSYLINRIEGLRYDINRLTKENEALHKENQYLKRKLKM